jgi:hypothetical protein
LLGAVYYVKNVITLGKISLHKIRKQVLFYRRLIEQDDERSESFGKTGDPRISAARNFDSVGS